MVTSCWFADHEVPVLHLAETSVALAQAHFGLSVKSQQDSNQKLEQCELPHSLTFYTKALSSHSLD